MATILIVDDEVVIKLILETLLRRENHTVVTADNGALALSFLAQNSVDLVITDIIMPEMDGLTFLEKLRVERGCEDLPVILLTAVGDTRWRTQAMQIGVDTILTKPIGSKELLQAIEELLKLSAQVDKNGRNERSGWN